MRRATDVFLLALETPLLRLGGASYQKQLAPSRQHALQGGERKAPPPLSLGFAAREEVEEEATGEEIWRSSLP